MATSFKQKVIDVLRRAFGDVTDGLERTTSGRITGFIVSAAFDRLDHKQRQQKVFNALKEGLSQVEYQKVGAIVTLSPAETKVA